MSALEKLKMSKRNYDKEIQNTINRKYSYSFDVDIMNPYFVKTIVPFMDRRKILEIGSSRGFLTIELLKFFDKVVGVEPSITGVESLKKIGNKQLEIINSTIEEYKANSRYNSIVISHVLEHIEDRVGALKHIKSSLLSDDGIIAVIVPNGNSISRQIAVEMGILDSVQQVSIDEAEHGHKITYTVDSLRAELLEAGLVIVFQTGIMIKQFANFQWDLAIENGIVGKEFFDAAYNVGLKYPELCSSILVLCKKTNNILNARYRDGITY